MNPTALVLALAAFLLWGVSPLFDKAGMRLVSPLAGLTIRVVGAAVLVALYALCAGTWKEIAAAPRPALGYLLGSAACGAVLGQFAYYAALKYGDVSRVLPVAAAYPLVTVALAILFFREGVTVPKVAGAALIVAGIVVLKGWG